MTTKNISNSIRKLAICLSIMVLVISVLLSSFPKSFSADYEENLESMLAFDFEVIEIIKDTEEEMIYKTLEDGIIYLYEEQTIDNTVTTSKFLLDGNKPILSEKFETTSVLNEDTISTTQKDLLTNKTFSETTINLEVASDPDITVYNPPVLYSEPIMSTTTTNAWVNTRSAGSKYSYYKYSNGGGIARSLSSYEKRVGSYTTAFDTYTRNVDATLRLERSALRDVIGLTLLEQGFKAIKSPTIANIKAFFGKTLTKMPTLSIIFLTFDYFSAVNKTIRSYNAISAPLYKWK